MRDGNGREVLVEAEPLAGCEQDAESGPGDGAFFVCDASPREMIQWSPDLGMAKLPDKELVHAPGDAA